MLLKCEGGRGREGSSMVGLGLGKLSPKNPKPLNPIP